jgi:hypothetical protein
LTAVNEAGNNALGIAVMRGRESIANILLDNGDNPYLPLAVVDSASVKMKRLLNEHKTAKHWLRKVF